MQIIAVEVDDRLPPHGTITVMSVLQFLSFFLYKNRCDSCDKKNKCRDKSYEVIAILLLHLEATNLVYGELSDL